MLMSTKLGRMLTSLEGLLSCHTTLCSRGHMRSRDKLKPLNLQYHDAYDTKLEKGVTYPDGVRSIKTHDPSITWSSKIT